MFKLLPISAMLLLYVGLTYAQNNGTNLDPTTTTTSPGTYSTTPNTNGDTTVTSPNTITPGTNGVTGTGVNSGTSTPPTSPTPTQVSTPPSSTPGMGSDMTEVSNSTSATIPSSSSVTAPVGFNCTGSMPQWNLSISKDLITYSSSKAASMKIKPVTPLTPVGDTTGSLQVYEARADNGKPVTILVKKNATGCTNASGQSYQYDAFVVFNNMVVTGCCNPK